VGELREAIGASRALLDESRTAAKAQRAFIRADAAYHDPANDPHTAHRALKLATAKAKHYGRSHRHREHNHRFGIARPKPAPGPEATGFAPTTPPGHIYPSKAAIERQAKLRAALARVKR